MSLLTMGNGMGVLFLFEELVDRPKPPVYLPRNFLVSVHRHHITGLLFGSKKAL